MSRVFTNSLKDQVSKTQKKKKKKKVLNAAFLYTPHYKIRTKGKMKQSMEWSSTIPYTLV